MTEDWIQIELGKICAVNMGQSPPSSTYNRDGEGMPFFQGKAEFTELHPVVEKWCTAPKKTAKAGDILMSVRAPVGSTNVANIDCAIGRGLAAISYPFGYRYLLYFFKLIEKKLDDQGTGTTFKAISGSLLRSQIVPLAPLPEQRAIVAKIEQLFSELDNGVTNLKAAKDKLEIYRQAVLKKAFEGELTKEWRIKQKKEIKLEFIGFGDLCKFTQGIQVPIPNQSEVQKKGQVRFLRIIDFTQGNEPPRFIDNPGERYLVNSSDIALVRYGTVGFVCTGKEGAIANNLFKVAPDERLINPYLIHFLNSHLFKSHLKPKGATMQALSFGLIKPIPIPVFEIDEQKQIVQEIESRLSVCDNIFANIEEGLEKSEALRQSILKQAFEGKLLSEEELESCKKEPDWEPAEQLLARIKAGKETSVKKEKAHAKQTPKKKIHHVEYYKRTLLAAEIVWQLHQQPTLGHLKLQKLIYLCQESGNMQLPTNFLQQAAGPYDPQMARSIDKQLKTKKWFAYRKNELLKYEPLEKAGGHQTDLKKYYTKDINNIQKVIGLFRTAKSDQIEIVATLYACWKKIIREKAVFSENLLIKRFYEWSEEKSKYPESRVKKAVEWMREKGIVPVNAGKQTIDE